MTNYNGRLDEILETLSEDDKRAMRLLAYGNLTVGDTEKLQRKNRLEAKQAINSLIKELVKDAKPKTMPSNLSPENYEKCERVVNQYHQNLLKELEENSEA